MLLIQSILVYFLFAFLLYNNARLAINDSRNRWHSRNMFSLPSHYWMIVFIFCIISGLRWDVGVDHLAYMSSYQQSVQGIELVRESRSLETGYLYLTNLFSTLGIHTTIYFGVLAFFQIYFIMLAFRDNRRAVPYMMIVMVLGTYYLCWMNGIRQMIAACAFVWAVQFIQQKKFIKYLLFIFWAYLWHHSCLILLPVFLLSYDKTIWKNKFLNISILFVCLVLGQSPTWIGIISKFSGLLSFMGYDMYSDMMDNLLDQSNFSSHGFGPRMLFIFISYFFIIYMYPKVRNYCDDANLDLYFKLSFIGICMFYLFDSTGVELRRPAQYFEIFTLPMLGYTLYYLKSAKSKFLYLFLLFSSSMFIFLQCYADFIVPASMRRSTLYQFYHFFN